MADYRIRMAALAIGLMTVTVANAATRVQLRIKQPSSHWTQTLFIDKGKVVVQGSNADTRPALLFDQAGNQFTFIDHGKRSYLVLDGAMVDQLSAAIYAVGLGRPAATRDSKPMSQIQTGELRSINGYRCAISRVSKSGQLGTDLCLADSGAVPMPADDYRTFRAMLIQAGKINEKAKQFPSALLAALPDVDPEQFEGLPVWVFDRDKQVSVMVIKISKGVFASETPLIPPGYRQLGLGDLLSRWQPM